MIFCVEDDPGIREIELYTLRSVGFTAEGFADGAAFWAALKSETPQLILLDIMLPEEDGVTILKKLRQNTATKDVPVIMATAKGTEYDKIQSLDLGADDYLTKPFGMMEMVSRVKAVLRRSAPKEKKENLLVCGSLCVDCDRHLVTVNEERIDLTLKEYELLVTFLSNKGRVYTRDALLSAIWDMDYDGETRTVDVHIRTLRQKLGAAADCVETVRGVGYRLREEQEEKNA